MAAKKTNKFILASVILLSVFSFIFTNADACHTLNSPEYTQEMEMGNIESDSQLLPEIYLVKIFVSKALDILGSNYQIKSI